MKQKKKNESESFGFLKMNILMNEPSTDDNTGSKRLENYFLF